MLKDFYLQINKFKLSSVKLFLFQEKNQYPEAKNYGKYHHSMWELLPLKGET